MKNFYQKSRLTMLQHRVSSLQNDYERINLRKDEVNQQLNETQELAYNLEEQYIKNKAECELKEEEIYNLKLARNEFDNKFQTALSQRDEAKKYKEREEMQLLGLNPNTLKSQIDDLSLEMTYFDVILSTPEPKPEYKIDGEYCINNIYHCQNHPPRQVLINGEEIEVYRRSMADAKARKDELLTRRQQLEDRYDEMQRDYAQLQQEVMEATNNYQAAEENISDVQREIAENTALYDQASQEYNDLVGHGNKISFDLSNARNKIYDLTGESARLDYEARNIYTELTNAEAQLERQSDYIEQMQYHNSNSGYSNTNFFSKEESRQEQDDADIAVLSKQQFMQGPSTDTEQGAEGNTHNFNFDMLRLAMQELEEQGFNFKETAITAVNDLLGKVGASKMGSVPGLIMQNTNIITNIHKRVDKVNDDTMANLDDGGHDRSPRK